MEKQAGARSPRNVNFHAAAARPPEGLRKITLNHLQSNAYGCVAEYSSAPGRAFAIAHPERGIAIAACFDRLRTERYAPRTTS